MNPETVLRFALLGDPVEHSLSPRLFSLFARETGISLSYQVIKTGLTELPARLKTLEEEGCRGVNFTSPLKEEALALVDVCSPLAQKAGAINLLYFRPDGSRYGDNSDGQGLVRDLQGRLGYRLKGRSILVLGAGGAARGILAPLLQQEPQRIRIANRQEARAKALAEPVGPDKKSVYSCAWSEIASETYDLVLHATSAGVQGEKLSLPSGILNPGACCYDLSYGKAALPFLSWAKEQGATLRSEGLGMLVEQAAVAFSLWCQQEVDTNLITPIISDYF